MTDPKLDTLCDIKCPFCSAIFKRSQSKEDANPLLFCAYCGANLKASLHEETSPHPTQLDFSSVYSKEHRPNPQDIQGAIGQYLLLKSIAKGGMGEVFLAFDTISGRQVALKRIRPDFSSTPTLRHRFLKEARITSQLIHPSIIPIYNIHIDDDLVYYTMPYVQGTTLRQLFKKARDDEEKGLVNHSSGTSLIRIFLSIAQAIAYAHSRGILHRDIKPENIIIGPYGQIIILDWGLTKLIDEEEGSLAAPDLEHTKTSLSDEAKKVLEERVNDVCPKAKGLYFDTVPCQCKTRLGKLVGTVAYMAPERAKGKPASVQTDIYALGVILYQILTLTFPYRRKTIESFLATADKEQFVPPELRAPYRDVPRALSELTRRCLEKDPSKRIQSCDEIVDHIENFLEGRSEWYFVQSLKHDCKNDWQLQENILFSEFTSHLKRHESSDWYRLMISKHPFSDNVKVELSVTLHQGAKGIGILLAVPSEKERQSLTDGYCLWLSTEKDSDHGTILLRSSIIVAEAPNIFLRTDKKQDIIVEKTDQSFVLFLDGKEVFRHVSHVPVTGSHIGLLVKDGVFSIDKFNVSIGSQNIMVNCLAVPDAFLTARAYDRAFLAYTRLAELFPGRAEGREALFRAGIACLEDGKHRLDPAEREALFTKAIDQFHQLRNTAGAPLEYLGKAFVYQATSEHEEEAKCFEIAFRRYPHHPCLRVLHEQLIVRLHESLKHHRIAASHFIALALRYLPPEMALPSTKKLLLDIKTEWEWPHYFPERLVRGENRDLMLLALSFWLKLPYIANDVLETLLNTPILPTKKIETALLTLKSLEYDASKGIERCRTVLSAGEQEQYEDLFFFLKEPPESCLACIADKVAPKDEISSLFVRAAIVFVDLFLLKNIPIDHNVLLTLRKKAPLLAPLTAGLVELLLRENLNEEAFSLLKEYEAKEPITEKNPLFFLKGCFIANTKGEQAALDFFRGAKDCAFPPSWVVAAYVIAGKIHLRPKGWLPKTYAYELDTLKRHLKLFSRFASKSWQPPVIP